MAALLRWAVQRLQRLYCISLRLPLACVGKRAHLTDVSLAAVLVGLQPGSAAPLTKAPSIPQAPLATSPVPQASLALPSLTPPAPSQPPPASPTAPSAPAVQRHLPLLPAWPRQLR